MTIESNFRALLLESVSNKDYAELGSLLGYSTKRIQHFTRRLMAIMDDDRLGLGSSRFDFKYSDEAFVKALSKALDLSKVDCLEFIREVNQCRDRERQAPKVTILIDTNFIRTSEPVFALAAMENRRRMKVDRDIVIQGEAAYIAEIKRLIIEHYHSCDGELPMWGKIVQYIAEIGHQRALYFSPEGALIKEVIKQKCN